MIIEVLSLFFLLDPGHSPMNGIYCDEISEQIMEYQRATGAFSQDDLKRIFGNCTNWEEGYEERVKDGEEEAINNQKYL